MTSVGVPALSCVVTSFPRKSLFLGLHRYSGRERNINTCNTTRGGVYTIVAYTVAPSRDTVYGLNLVAMVSTAALTSAPALSTCVLNSAQAPSLAFLMLPK